jgi:hypothetical protein
MRRTAEIVLWSRRRFGGDNCPPEEHRQKPDYNYPKNKVARVAAVVFVVG